MEALALAEKLDVGFVEAHRPRERESAERFRERMTRREVIAADDKIAHAETQLESLLKMQKMLDRYSLDPEDRERIEAELREQILRNDQDSGKILGPS